MDFIPALRKGFTPCLDVVIVFILVLAALDKLITGPVLAHKRIEGGRLQPGDPFYEGLCKPVVNISVTLFLLQPALEGLHSTNLPALEQHIKIQAHAHPSPFPHLHIVYIVRTSIVEYFTIFFPVFQGIHAIIFGPHIYRRQGVDGHLETHVEWLVRGKVLHSESGGEPTQVGEINGISGREPDAVMP